MHFTLFDGIALFTLTISLTVYLQKPAPFYLKLFPIFFFCYFIIGLIEKYLGQHGKYNSGLYNSWGIIEFCFYFFILRLIISKPRPRRIIIYILFIYPVLCLIILYFQQKIGFNPVNFTVGCLITVTICIYYFAELFQKAETQYLSRLPAFWITSAILFNIVLAFPTFALISFMKTTPKIVAYNLNAIFYIINTLVAILYSIGFLCRIRIRKSTL
jgi:hypothetical protein